MLLYLKDKSKVVLLPRGKDQAIHYEQEKFQGIEVLNKPLESSGNCFSMQVIYWCGWNNDPGNGCFRYSYHISLSG